MIFFDGNYRSKSIGEAESKPIKEWEYSWRVRIINLELGLYEQGVQFLRPVVIFAVQNGGRPLKTNCAESMGRRICRDFELNVEEILWIEYFPSDSEPLKVASFRPRTFMGPNTFYTVSWRVARPNELMAIEAFIPDISCQ
jgi:hypothetical protein